MKQILLISLLFLPQIILGQSISVNIDLPQMKYGTKDLVQGSIEALIGQKKMTISAAQIDEKQVPPLSFYTGDKLSDFLIFVEGITKDGQPFVGQKTITVLGNLINSKKIAEQTAQLFHNK